MKKIKIITKRNRIRMVLGALILSSSIGVSNKRKEKRPDPISEGIYEYVYDTEKEGLHIKQDLEEIKTLIVSAEDCDFKDIARFPNLQEIKILNPEKLTKEDKIYINSYEDIKKIKLILNGTSIQKKNIIDLSWIDEKINIVIDKNANLELFRKDLVDLYLYNLYNNLNEKDKNRISFECLNKERMEELTKWHYILSSIVNSFSFTEETTEEEKVMTIAYYVTRALEYDPEIAERLNSETKKLYDEKIYYYNHNLLGALFNREGNYGICCNYAALTSILGYYANVPLKYTSGIYDEGENNQHAWCTYKDTIVDTTFLDENSSYISLSEKLYNTLDEEKKERYIRYIRKIVFETSNLYKAQKTILEKLYDQNEEKNYIINEEEMEIYNLNQKLLLIYEMINAISILLLGENLVNKKDKEKKYCKTKNK